MQNIKSTHRLNNLGNIIQVVLQLLYVHAYIFSYLNKWKFEASNPNFATSDSYDHWQVTNVNEPGSPL